MSPGENEHDMRSETDSEMKDSPGVYSWNSKVCFENVITPKIWS